MNKKNNNKGFTLAELLIVVAIIAVLVAIAIPVFSTQLEKSRDSVSVANLRSAYAQAQTEALTATKSTDSKTNTSDVKVEVSAATPGSNGADTAARLETVQVRNVAIKSQKQNDWSGLALDLPFYDKLKTAVDDTTAEANHWDHGQNGYVTVTFHYTAAGQDLDIAWVELGDMYNEAVHTAW